MGWESSLIAYATLLAEFAIAFAIYYEIEENRASGFLSEALGAPYHARRKIYEEYVGLTGASTAVQRAEMFRDKILKQTELREACDLQIVYFSKSHYMLRWSLFHRKLIVTWFPHVLVRLWLMLSQYILERPRVHGRWEREFMNSVLKSLKIMESHGLEPIVIYSSDRTVSATISPEELRDAKTQLEGLLRPRCGPS